jgi:hypothetical protein
MSTPLCPICNKSIYLETSKTEENGRAVHEECYIQQLLATQPQHPPHSAQNRDSNVFVGDASVNRDDLAVARRVPVTAKSAVRGLTRLLTNSSSTQSPTARGAERA